jgi:protein-tyrosine phosphatase
VALTGRTSAALAASQVLLTVALSACSSERDAAPALAGFSSAVVTREPIDASTASFRLDWTAAATRPNQIKIFEGPNPEDTPNLLTTVPGSTSAFTTEPLTLVTRHYFRLVADDGAQADGFVFAERGLPDLAGSTPNPPGRVTGAANIRDLGGLPTRHGRVKWGKIFRSGALLDTGALALSAAQKAFLDGMGIKTIVDIRAPDEIGNPPNRYLPPGATVVVQPIHDPNVTPTFNPVRLLCSGQQGAPPPNDPTCFNTQTTTFGENGELLKAFVTDGTKAGVWDPSTQPDDPTYGYRVSNRDGWKRLLEVLGDPARYPVIVMDNGGVSRAGFAAGLIEHLLEVPDHWVLDDYLASNDYAGGVEFKNASLDYWVSSGWLKNRSMLDQFVLLQPDYWQAAENEVSRLWADWNQFALHGIEATSEELRAMRTLLVGP